MAHVPCNRLMSHRQSLPLASQKRTRESPGCQWRKSPPGWNSALVVLSPKGFPRLDPFQHLSPWKIPLENPTHFQGGQARDWKAESSENIPGKNKDLILVSDVGKVKKTFFGGFPQTLDVGEKNITTPSRIDPHTHNPCTYFVHV